MADHFARQKSTRWVKADVPSYGGWGDEYDDYDGDSQHQDSPTSSRYSQLDSPVHPEHHQAPLGGSTLVLSIDKLKAGNNDDDESDSSFDEEPTHQYNDEAVGSEEITKSPEHLHGESTSRSSTDTRGGTTVVPTRPDSALLETSGASAQNHDHEDISAQTPRRPLSPLKNLSHSSVQDDLLPPTPTYQSDHKFAPISPDQDQSDRSYLSDADSIQREPVALNLGPSKDKISESLEPLKTHASSETAKEPEVAPQASAPETLVLSIDKLNTHIDDSSSDEGLAHRGADFDDENHNGGQEADRNSQDDNDDWGYNSDHSSNLENETVPQSMMDLPLNAPASEAKKSTSSPKHKVDTEALDSLINSLSKMESSSGYGNEDLDYSFGEDDSLNNEPATGNHLPTLDSIHDISLPDFTHRFSSDEEVEPLPITKISEEGLKSKHEKFVSNVRQPSIKKAPPTSYHEPVVEQKHEDRNSTVEHSPDDQSLTDTLEDTVKATAGDELNSAENGTDSSSPQPPSADSKTEMPDVSRRSSTMSTATFNMGAWNPNTNKFRDQFVNDNDNESQFNMTIDSKNDAAYKKFTGSEQSPNYAESVTNASFVSVPETIDANLHKISEDQSEDDDHPDCVSTFSTPKTLLAFPSPGNSSVPSVFRDHQYENGKFHEQSAHSSVDKVNSIEEEEESKSTLGEIKETRSRSESFSATKARLKKYPVSNWKTIMSLSQPVDRIQMLKKARYDEEMYDTGLSAWLNAVLKSTESASPMQIGKIATHAYQNAQHSEIRRHTSIRSKVNQVRDKLDSGNFEKASSLGKKFFNRGKKLMKQGSE